MAAVATSGTDYSGSYLDCSGSSRDLSLAISQVCNDSSLRILETVSDFEDLRSEWSAWIDNPEADLDFLSIHLRHTQGVVRPHVIVVYRCGRPDCMLVGWLFEGSVAFRVGSFVLFQSHARILRFVNGGFLGNQSRQNSEVLLSGIIRSLQDHEAQAVEFSQLRTDSHLYDLVKRQPDLFCREHFAPLRAHHYLTLPASFDEFLRGLSGNRRRQFKRDARRLLRDFPDKVRFQSVRSERDVEDFARDADAISRKTYRHALGEGFVNNLEMRETLRAAAKRAALRASVLHVGDQPVAFASGILSNKKLYGTFTGYDSDFEKYHPGLQTLMRLIEESCESSGSLSQIDAGCGDSPFKRALFQSSWMESPVWIFAPSAKGLSLHLFKVLSTVLHSLAMRFLAKSHQLRKIRRMWHCRAMRQFST